MGQLQASIEAALGPVVERAIGASHVPGIALAVWAGGRPPAYLVCGHDAAGRPLAADSLFTVASITKLASALLVLRLVEDGALGLDDPLARHLPQAVLADVRSSRRGTELEPFNSAFWRSLGLPWGGLVTTVDGALRLVRAFRSAPAGFLGPATLAEATRNQAGDLGGGQVSPLF